MRLPVLFLSALVLVAPTDLLAQQTDTAAARRAPLGVSGGRVAAARSSVPGTPHYDVVLEVPELSVDSIGLEVDDLRAHLALNAQVASLVVLNAGVDVNIEQVRLRIEGVVAEAYLYVDLDNVAVIVDRALTTLENNPEILEQLLATIDTAVGVVGSVGGSALRPGGVVDRTVGTVGQTLETVTAPGGLLSETLNSAGQTVRTVLTTGGSLVEQTLNGSGGVLSTRTLGSVTSLPLVRETTNTAGQTVRRVRDTLGNVIEYTLGQGGALSNVRVLERARP